MAHRVALLVALLVALAFVSVSDAAKTPKTLVFTVIGDWGVPAENLKYTGVIASVSDAKSSQFTLALGDNFYKGVTTCPTCQHGVSSVNDPKWKSVFEDNFQQPFFKKNWYVIAGNHDYDGNEKAQVDYTDHSHRWKFPKLYYNFVKKSKKTSVEFFMMDTQVLWSGDDALKEYGRKRDLKQLKKLEDKLRNSKAHWKIAVGHHPIYTSKGKRDWMVQKVVPLFHKYKVALYLNGHVHTFQHMKSPQLDYITVGGTGIQGSIKVGKKVGGVKHVFTYPTQAQEASATCAGNACRGFAIVTVKSSKNMVLQYYNTLGQLVYTSSKIKNPKK